jgi:nicotinamide mononucleotide adenylyltransferase
MLHVKPIDGAGIIVGRFQTHKLHPGHRELIEFVMDRHPKTIVALGCAPGNGDKRNPLDYAARVQLLRENYPTILTFPIYDHPSDVEWSKILDATVGLHLVADETATLYGGRDSFVARYHGKLHAHELVNDSGNFWNASEIRAMIARNTIPDENFRAGVIWARMNTSEENVVS